MLALPFPEFDPEPSSAGPEILHRSEPLNLILVNPVGWHGAFGGGSECNSIG